MPIASFVTLRFSSSAASSSSRRTRALACSATLFVAGPRRCSRPCSVSWVCMPSPVNHLGEDDSGCKRRADDEERRRAAALSALLLLLRLLRAARRRRRRRGRRRRSLALGAGRDQARLQLPKEGGVLGELLGKPF